MTVEALLFDLDGTLVDTLDDITDAMNHVLCAAGLPRHAADAYRRFVGDGVRSLVERALPLAERQRLEEHLEAFRARYGAHLLDRSRPYAGVEATLEALRARGVPMAILSNKPHDATLRVVDALFPAGLFASVLGQRPQVPKKPDPAAALEAAATLARPPERIAFVGDMHVDVQTALAAGMRPVGVAWGFRSADELRRAGAERILARPEDLLALVGDP